MSFVVTESPTYPGSYYLWDSHGMPDTVGAIALIKKTDDGYEILTRSDVRVRRDGIELQEPYTAHEPVADTWTHEPM